MRAGGASRNRGRPAVEWDDPSSTQALRCEPWGAEDARVGRRYCAMIQEGGTLEDTLGGS